MCRLVAYLGPPTSLDRVMLAPAHSLVVQSYRPREMRSGVVNADGFGVGWYALDGDASEPPAVYTSVMPIWGDPNLPRLAPRIRARCVLANVRSATPGMTIEQANVQPFTHGRLLFLHNGLVRDFRRAVMRPLRRSIRDEYEQAIWGNTDSEHVFALLLDELHERPRELVAALAGTFHRLAEWCRPQGLGVLFNVVVGDGERMVAVRAALGEPAPSLYMAQGAAAWPEAVVVASEQLDDDPAWREIPPGSAVVAAGDSVDMVPFPA